MFRCLGVLGLGFRCLGVYGLGVLGLGVLGVGVTCLGCFGFWCLRLMTFWKVKRVTREERAQKWPKFRVG